jgi:serine/threonine-protein kinase TTK/MPS1
MSSNHPTFDIPSLIPPLPSSSHGKENERKVRNAKDRHADSSMSKDSPGVLKSTNRSTLGLRTPQTGNKDKSSASRHANTGSASRHQTRLQLSPSPGSIGSTTKQGKGRSVLRFGETTEFLFCITGESSLEHRKLSRSIADGSQADDPKAWRQVLRCASELKSSNGTDLIRLHRRATLRFPLDQMHPENREDVLGIWLSFASIHAKLGMMDEARRTWRHMENQKMPLGASFYVEVSRMEKDFDHLRSEEVLRRGLAEKAEPREMLQEALNQLGETTSAPTASSKVASKSAKVPSLSPRKRKIESESSPKRQKTEDGFVVTTEQNIAVQKTSKPQPLGLAKPPLLAGFKANTKLNHPQSNMITSSNSKPTLTSKKSAALRSRPSRLAPTRLGRKGLSGGAKRVESAETSLYEDSESEPESTVGDNTNPLEPSSASNTSSQPASTIKKIDLSYMWEWDPTARGKTQELKTKKPSMEKIEEASSSSGQTTTASSQATNRSGETTTGTTSTASSIHSRKSSSHLHTETKESTTPACDQNPSSTAEDVPVQSTAERPTPSQDDVLSQVNREFLPLVHENNILHVNRSSYAKLGVIGKGGSCKVYRALSKKCTVVAIKKVKLDGMDKKAIEGYANEISLLKRLQGNPAIIQMYDSEVDLSRKSIFVVMEVGEADLNHILQQRALAGACRSLNMNFIRLTWQQMLSAVHCIHEERIIHSDLKPANFLFVRGALKLIDFGIAKAIQSDDTTNIYRESHIGTLNYMSPEAILDTETGSNGPRMRIGRVSTINAARIQITFIDCLSLTSAIFDLHHHRPPMYGPSAAFCMKWCMGRHHLQSCILFKSYRPLSILTIRLNSPKMPTAEQWMLSSNAFNETRKTGLLLSARADCSMSTAFCTRPRVANPNRHEIRLNQQYLYVLKDDICTLRVRHLRRYQVLSDSKDPRDHHPHYFPRGQPKDSSQPKCYPSGSGRRLLLRLPVSSQ